MGKMVISVTLLIIFFSSLIFFKRKNNHFVAYKLEAMKISLSLIEIVNLCCVDKCFLENNQQEGRWVSWFGIAISGKFIKVL